MSTSIKKSSEGRLTRRQAIASGVAIAAPSIASVASGATDSGFVEVSVTATLPTGTSANVQAFEDLTGDGSANNTQSNDLSEGTNTYEFEALEGFEAQAYEYWFEITLESNDAQDATPEIDSMTITLPEGEPEEPPEEEEPSEDQEGIFDLWDNFLVFTVLTIFTVGGIGLTSRSMALASFGAYLVFAYIAVTTGNSLLIGIFYVSMVMVFVGFAFKLWRLEGGET